MATGSDVHVPEGGASLVSPGLTGMLGDRHRRVPGWDLYELRGIDERDPRAKRQLDVQVDASAR